MRKEFNSRRIIVLYTNMAGVMFCENNLYSKVMKPQFQAGLLAPWMLKQGLCCSMQRK